MFGWAGISQKFLQKSVQLLYEFDVTWILKFLHPNMASLHFLGCVLHFKQTFYKNLKKLNIVLS